MNTPTRPAYAEAMAAELSRFRIEVERAKADLERRPNPKSRKRLGEAYEKLVNSLVGYGQIKEAVAVETRWLELLKEQLQRANTSENRKPLADLYEARGELYFKIGQILCGQEDYRSSADLRCTIAEETGDGTDRVRAGFTQIELAMYLAADEIPVEDWQTLLQDGLEGIREGIHLQDTPENRKWLYDGCGIAASCFEAISDEKSARELWLQQEDLLASLPDSELTADPEEFLRELGDPTGKPGCDDAFLDCIHRLRRKREAVGDTESERETFCELLENAAICAAGVRDRLVQALCLQALSLRREQDSRESRAMQADFLRKLSDTYRLQPWEFDRPGMTVLFRLTGNEIPDSNPIPSARATALALLYAQKALPVLQQLMEEGVLDVRASYAGCCESLGVLALEQGKIAQAQEYYLSALPVRQELAETTDFLCCRRALANDLHGLGRVLEQRRELDQAITLYEKECVILQKLVEECGDRFDKSLLGNCYDALSEVSRSMGDLRNTKNYKLRKLSIQ